MIFITLMTIIGGLVVHVNAHQLSFVDLKVMYAMSKLGHNVLLLLGFTSCFQWHKVTTWDTRQVHCKLSPPGTSLKLTSVHFDLIYGGVRHCERKPPENTTQWLRQGLSSNPSVHHKGKLCAGLNGPYCWIRELIGVSTASSYWESQLFPGWDARPS